MIYRDLLIIILIVSNTNMLPYVYMLPYVSKEHIYHEGCFVLCLIKYLNAFVVMTFDPVYITA